MVNHKVLLRKLSYYRICGKELTWFSNYLTNREQITVVNDISSDPRPITVGVPQGSILGPFLFILFINDCRTVLASKVVLYADNTSIMYSSKDTLEINNVLNEELQTVSEWMHSNKLTLNAFKSKVMTFSTSQKMKRNNNNLTVKVDNEVLENVTEFKYLVVWFDQYLRWDTHMNIYGQVGVLSANGKRPLISH